MRLRLTKSEPDIKADVWPHPAEFKALTVGCRCGWEGEDRQLIRVNKHERQRYCPACGRQFQPYRGW